MMRSGTMACETQTMSWRLLTACSPRLCRHRCRSLQYPRHRRRGSGLRVGDHCSSDSSRSPCGNYMRLRGLGSGGLSERGGLRSGQTSRVGSIKNSPLRRHGGRVGTRKPLLAAVFYQWSLAGYLFNCRNQGPATKLSPRPATYSIT